MFIYETRALFIVKYLFLPSESQRNSKKETYGIIWTLKDRMGTVKVKTTTGNLRLHESLIP